MMDGVTILSERTEYDIPIIACVIFYMLAIAGLVIAVTILVISIKEHEFSWRVLLGLTAIIFISSAGAISSTVSLCRGSCNYYKVTISEDVSFVEFNSKYEIISQEGQIYEIKEIN